MKVENRNLLPVKYCGSIIVGLSFLLMTLSAMALEPLERSATNPTGWKWYYNVSSSTISNQVQNGYRVIDIEVKQTSPYRFNVALVKNSGVHASGWWWYYGQTASQLSTKLANNNARLIDIESYYVNGSRRFAAVMIQNAGSRASGWYYYYGKTLNGLSNKLSEKNARLIDVDTYVRNGTRYYNAVMIPNTGSNAKAWWWYTNVTISQVSNFVQNNGARLIDIERQSNGRYTVVMIKNDGRQWWWQVGATASTVSNFAAQYGARIVDIESYLSNGQQRFNVIYLNNVNQQTARLRDFLNAKSNGGNYGVYVKRVDGSTSVALKASAQFEPASTIKALHHIHGMKRVHNGWDGLNDWVLGYNNYVLNSDGENTSCPEDTSPVWKRRYQAHDLMMKNSDNRWTQALRSDYGQWSLNFTASGLGMTKTSLNHRIGCGGDALNSPNQLTLVDAGKLYEAVRDGYLGNGVAKDAFYDYMSTGKGNVTTVINQEAAKLRMSLADTNQFHSLVEVAAKAGSYTLNSKKYKSLAGWVSLPAKYSNGNIYQREYVHGFFIEKASWLSSTFDTWDMRGESLREQIRYALTTFKLY